MKLLLEYNYGKREIKINCNCAGGNRRIVLLPDNNFYRDRSSGQYNYFIYLLFTINRDNSLCIFLCNSDSYSFFAANMSVVRVLRLIYHKIAELLIVLNDAVEYT